MAELALFEFAAFIICIYDWHLKRLLDLSFFIFFLQYIFRHFKKSYFFLFVRRKWSLRTAVDAGAALFLSNSWEYGVEEANQQSRSTIWQAIWQILNSDWLLPLSRVSSFICSAHGPNMCEVFEGQNGVTTNRTVLPGIEKVINRQIITKNTKCHQVAKTNLKS